MILYVRSIEISEGSKSYMPINVKFVSNEHEKFFIIMDKLDINKIIEALNLLYHK